MSENRSEIETGTTGFDGPDATGHFGPYGGIFVGETLISAVEELAQVYQELFNDDAFWATTAFQNIWAIQSGTSNSSDEVEHKDSTPHCSLADEGIDFQQFVTKWDSVHLAHLQGEWDADNVEGETEAEKITRVGARPTSYSS